MKEPDLVCAIGIESFIKTYDEVDWDAHCPGCKKELLIRFVVDQDEVKETKEKAKEMAANLEKIESALGGLADSLEGLENA